MSMKVLVADTLPEETIGRLTGLGCFVTQDPKLKGPALVQAVKVGRPDILIVRSTRVDKQVIEASHELSLVIRAGAGFDTIDVEAASERSVYVANCPGKNSIAVAELAMGLILSLDRMIPDNVSAFRCGTWDKTGFSKARGICGRTLGIVGMGRIGRELVQRARGFGMKITAWSRSLTKEAAEELGVIRRDSPLEVAADSDMLSVHLALTDETRGLLGTGFFDSMKPGAIFVNTSRAEIVDQPALERAIKERGIRAGLDVIAGEPAAGTGTVESPLQSAGGTVYVTHHIGASTEQAQNAVAQEVADIVTEYMATGRVRNCVNLLERTPAKWVLSVHHRNRVGILACVFDVIRDYGVNVETVENVIFSGGQGACAKAQIDDELPDEALETIRGSSSMIFSVSLHRLS